MKQRVYFALLFVIHAASFTQSQFCRDVRTSHGWCLCSWNPKVDEYFNHTNERIYQAGSMLTPRIPMCCYVKDNIEACGEIRILKQLNITFACVEPHDPAFSKIHLRYIVFSQSYTGHSQIAFISVPKVTHLYCNDLPNWMDSTVTPMYLGNPVDRNYQSTFNDCYSVTNTSQALFAPLLYVMKDERNKTFGAHCSKNLSQMTSTSVPKTTTTTAYTILSTTDSTVPKTIARGGKTWTVKGETFVSLTTLLVLALFVSIGSIVWLTKKQPIKKFCSLYKVRPSQSPPGKLVSHLVLRKKSDQKLAQPKLKPAKSKGAITWTEPNVVETVSMPTDVENAVRVPDIAFEDVRTENEDDGGIDRHVADIIKLRDEVIAEQYKQKRLK